MNFEKKSKINDFEKLTADDGNSQKSTSRNHLFWNFSKFLFYFFQNNNDDQLH